MANFDDEGDALIASVLEDSENPDTKLEFGRLIDTKWPEIINHPEFIGSHFMVTAFSLDDDCIYFKATADKIQQNRIGKTLITFKDVTQIDSQRNLATVTIVIDDIFSAVHLPLYNEEQNQTEMSVDHQPSPVTEQDFFEFEPQRTSTMEKQQQNSQIDIPLLSTGHIDLYELHRLYKASNQNISFLKWRDQQGVTAFQKENQATFSVPISIRDMGPTSKEARKARETWENTHSQHGLQFDDWFLVIGQETIEGSQDISTLSKIFRENDIDFGVSPPPRPTCTRCPPDSQCMFCTEETPSFEDNNEKDTTPNINNSSQQTSQSDVSQSIIPNSQQPSMEANSEDLIQLSESKEDQESSFQIITEDPQPSKDDRTEMSLSTTTDSESQKTASKKAYDPGSLLFKEVQREKRRRANEHFFKIQEKHVQDKIKQDYEQIQQSPRFFQIGFFQHHCASTYPDVTFILPSVAFPTDEELIINKPELAEEREIKLMLDANEQTTWDFIKDISITPEDFLPQGRLAMIYIPTYAYIPGYCVHKLGLKPHRLQSYARVLLWQKLNTARRAAQQLITSDMINDIKVTSWTIHLFNRIYNQAENGPNHTHLIDILQHHEALSLNGKYELHPIDVYDTLFRPLERLVAKGTKLHNSLIEARFDMKSRTHIYTKLIEIIQMGFKLNISPHEIYRNLSFIRQLAYEDLAHHSKHGFAPIQTLLPLDPFESDPNEKPLQTLLKRQVEDIIKEGLCNNRFVEHKISLPPAPGYLAEFPMIGGINMTINWMKFVVETHNDVLQHLGQHRHQLDKQERHKQLAQQRTHPKQHSPDRGEGSQNQKLPHKRLTIYMPEYTRKDLEEEEEASIPQASSYAATLKQRQNRVPIPLRRPNPSTEMKIFSLLK